MYSLWTSLSQRLGTCISRLAQNTNSVLSPLLTTRRSHLSTLAYNRCHLNPASPHKQTSFTDLLLHASRSSCPSVTVPSRSIATFEYMHRKGLYTKVRRKRKHPLEGRPQMRGVVLKTLVKKPKKPNSANRKCVRLRLTNGKEVTAYVPGEGHNLQEHNIVLVQGGRLQDTPGVKLVCVRGKYDLPHVKKRA